MANPFASGKDFATQFNIPTDDNLTPSSTDPFTGHASAGSAGDSMAGSFIDPNGLVGGLYNDIMGFTSQWREFENQWKMTEYENWWNSASEQMNRAKAAGINPLTAAAGISGGGTGSVAPAAGAASPSSASADALNSMASIKSNIGLTNAEADNQRSLAAKNYAELPWIPKINQGKFLESASNFMKNITEAGNEEIAAGGIAFDIMTGGLASAVKYLALFNGLRYKDQEFNNIKANYQLTMKEVESFDKRIESQLDLQSKQGLYLEQQRLKAQAETTYQNALNDIVKDLPGIQLPGAAAMIYAAHKYGVDSPQYQAFGRGLFDWSYNSSLGSYTSDSDTAFTRSYNTAVGNLSANADYKPFLDGLDVIKSAYEAMFKSLAENPTNIRGVFAKFAGDVKNALLLLGISQGDDIDRSKPVPMPYYTGD